MMFQANGALQSYLQAKPATRPNPTDTPPLGNAGGTAVADFAATLAATDPVAQQTMVAGGDPQALVEALTQTQLAMDTAVAVRDRVVEAYQEILRMPV
ncbi:flagellar hook-basal body complex protein FliE [Meridianimarinicoccus sp. RP-17]|uniref:flagellar hook-basal body complex protein FliE n=1 Tax=Meridianimarinicoccus zhengii TaxID=2056810 RepID=UPI000DAC7466|nr:flagellar hook-basal body complex protein FliE [Phycocomes zhengii]